MPILVQHRARRPRPAKELVTTYDSHRKGLNTFLLDNELDPEEAVELTNMRLVGKGILEPRGGTGAFYQADDNATVRMIADFYLNNELQLLSITDNGFLTKKNNSSYTRIYGSSFASGARPEMTQIYGKAYLVDGVRPLARYDGTSLLTYTKISRPTGLTVTKSSGTSGVFTWSWRVSAESDVGETLASDPITLASLPENLTTTNYVTVSWVAASPVSFVRGYVIYGRESGAESYLSRVPPSVSSWIDDGSAVASLIAYPPDADSTDGPTAKHIRRYKEKLLLANTADSKDLILWSGSGPNIDKFNYSIGGGYYSIDKETEDRWGITGLSEKEGKAIVFKGNAIYQVTFSFDSATGLNIPTVSKIVENVGCVAAKTIQEVENSIMFVAYIQGRGLALAKLDYEPNILSNVLRFQPISAKVQSIVDQVNMERIEETWSLYFNKKYHWFLPVGGSSWSCLVYDVERLAFVGPWTLTDAWSGGVHLDTENKYHLLLGKSDGNVVELADQYANDEATDFTWTFLSKKDDFKRPFQLKIIKDAKTKLRNISGGNVNISYIVEGQDGVFSTAKTVSAAAPSTLAGWGSRAVAMTDKSRSARWAFNPSLSASNSNVMVKYTLLNKVNVLSSQVKISGRGSKAQLLSTEITARELPRSVIPSAWR